MGCTVIKIIVCFHILQGVHSRTVDITGSTTGFQGTNSTSLECVFTKDNGDLLTAVTFYARNSSNNFEPIVAFSARRGNIFFSFWSYLFENVTQELTPVTDSSTAVEIQINHLLCKHEREYKCGVAFESLLGQAVPVDSNIINITVQVKPSKPESVEVLGKLVDNGMLSTTEYPPTGPTMESDSGTFATDVPTKPNNMYESGPFTEGDNVTFSCSGNVGKPPVGFKWEKVQSGEVVTTYNDTNTDIIYHSENCSYHRLSNITLQMSADDNTATVRCVVVESALSDEKLYADTDTIEVFYKVRLPNITKQPDQDMYGTETDTITLTCNSDGNPTPSYIWSKNGNIQLNQSVMVISNVNVNDNGTYMCNVSNYVDNEHIMYSTSVNIVIVDEIVTTTTRRTTTTAASGSTIKDESSTTKNDSSQQTMYIVIGVVASIVVIVVIIAVVVMCKRQSRNKGYDSTLTDKRTKSSPKPQRRADPYCSINLEDKPPKDVSDENTYKENQKHNLQYLKHEDVNAKETKPSEAPDEYAVVDKTKHKYMNSVNKDEVPEDPYALQSEGVYDTANDRRHKPDDHAETYDTTDMKKKSQPANGSEESQEPTAKSKPYENQSFVDDTNDNTKDDNKPLYQNERQETKTNTSF